MFARIKIIMFGMVMQFFTCATVQAAFCSKLTIETTYCSSAVTVEKLTAFTQQRLLQWWPKKELAQGARLTYELPKGTTLLKYDIAAGDWLCSGLISLAAGQKICMQVHDIAVGGIDADPIDVVMGEDAEAPAMQWVCVAPLAAATKEDTVLFRPHGSVHSGERSLSCRSHSASPIGSLDDLVAALDIAAERTSGGFAISDDALSGTGPKIVVIAKQTASQKHEDDLYLGWVRDVFGDPASDDGWCSGDDKSGEASDSDSSWVDTTKGSPLLKTN